MHWPLFSLGTLQLNTSPDCLKIIQNVKERVYTVPGTYWNTRYPDCVRNIHVVNGRGYTLPGTHWNALRHCFQLVPGIFTLAKIHFAIAITSTTIFTIRRRRKKRTVRTSKLLNIQTFYHLLFIITYGRISVARIQNQSKSNTGKNYREKPRLCIHYYSKPLSHLSHISRYLQ